jgi:hypothetical protein
VRQDLPKAAKGDDCEARAAAPNATGETGQPIDKTTAAIEPDGVVSMMVDLEMEGLCAIRNGDES